MLLRFRFSNYRSFRSEQEFSMIAGPLKEHDENLVKNAAIPESVLTAAAVYGANASGKTNLLRALHFMATAVKDSHTRWQPDEQIPRQQFAFLEREKDRPSAFTIDLIVDGVRYQYGFTVSDAAVLKEWLYAYPKGKRQSWFNRTVGTPMTFSEKMPGENRTIEALMRPNSLFLSTAAQNNHPALTPIYRWFSQSVTFVFEKKSPSSQGSVELRADPLSELCADPLYRESMARMLAFADLGVSDLRLGKQVVPEPLKRIMSQGMKPKDLENVIKGIESVKQVHLVHRAGDGSMPFQPDQESHGTIAYLALLGPILSGLQNGGVVCVDELDASLHPLLATRLIRLFSDRSMNPKGAQLIFNTHDTNLLNRGILRRDQIWFAEKEQDGSSQIYPLTDFQPRKDENLANGYLQGRYGAIPFLSPELLSPGDGTGHEEA